MAEYYALLSTLASVLNPPVADLSDRLGLPLVSALLLGLLGATSPCQLTTNLSALAYVSRKASTPTLAWRSAFAYLLGKTLVYTLVGGLLILLGLQVQQAIVPATVVVRKTLGPLLVLFGLMLLGLIRPSFAVGQGISDRIESLSSRGRSTDSFLLGAAFAFAFCPTLFLLFFGLLIPLAIQSRGGLLFPSVFALGTTLPLLLLLALFGLGLQGAHARLARVKRLDFYLHRAAGVVFVLVGLNEVFLYWLV